VSFQENSALPAGATINRLLKAKGNRLAQGHNAHACRTQRNAAWGGKPAGAQSHQRSRSSCRPEQTGLKTDSINASSGQVPEVEEENETAQYAAGVRAAGMNFKGKEGPGYIIKKATDRGQKSACNRGSPPREGNAWLRAARVCPKRIPVVGSHVREGKAPVERLTEGPATCTKVSGQR